MLKLIQNRPKLYVAAGFAVGYYVGRNFDLNVNVVMNRKAK